MYVNTYISNHRHLYPLQADPDPKVRERCAYRHSLLMGYTSSIPAVLRQLPTQPEQRRRDTLKNTGTYMATRWLVAVVGIFKPGVDMLLPLLHSPTLSLPPSLLISSSLPYSSLPLSLSLPLFFHLSIPLSLSSTPPHPQWILASLSRPSWQRRG